MSPTEQAHLRILKMVSEEPEISQRKLAERLGVSLGKTNYLLKALLDKGHIKVKNFRCNNNKLGYLYLLTPTGISAKLNLTRNYLTRKEEEYQALRDEIETLRTELNNLDTPASRTFATETGSTSHE